MMSTTTNGYFLKTMPPHSPDQYPNSKFEYFHDGSSVYSSRNSKLAEADLASFFVYYSQLETYGIARDKSHAYYYGAVISGADPSTFTLAAPAYFARDKDHVFADGVILPGADPKTFEPVDQITYRDSKSTYCHEEYTHNLEGADPYQIRSYPRSSFATDGVHVYSIWACKELQGADPYTFTPLSFDQTGADNKHTYSIQKNGEEFTISVTSK